jgi:thiol-disulfide isomerase/thioredoxin
VNLALIAREDGRLYALGAADSAAVRLRLDVFDAARGTLLASQMLDSGISSIELTAAGKILTRTRESVLVGSNPGARFPLTPPFALPDLHGDTVRLGDYTGRVTLVNFWASWCDPCREEFPYMAELYQSLDRQDFDIAAISDDVDQGEMREFVQRFQPPFPILVGGGRMKATYHYRGLPYSLLLDREGRIVRRIFGFSGPRAFAELRQAIANEISGP